ncbi:MAG: BACON domain-containing protein [bacterium]|nr:BACON domain-containing protein [bacterium]
MPSIGRGLSVWPLTLDFGGVKDELTLHVTSYCEGNIRWRAEADVPWLTVTPACAFDEYTSVTVAVTRPLAKELSVGRNTASIRFTGDGAVKVIPVTVWVWPEFSFEEYYDEAGSGFPLKQPPGAFISYEYANDVEVSPDGGYVAVGYIEQFSDEPLNAPAKNVVDSDAYLLKVGLDGEQEWSINWGGGGGDEAMAVVATDDGDYVVAGWQMVGDDFFDKGLTPGVYAQLTKVSPDGVIVWQKMYGDGSWWAWALAQTDDGGFILAGDDALAGGLPFYTPFLIKTDADGNQEWAKTYLGPADYYVYGINVASDGGFIVVGETLRFGVATKHAKASTEAPKQGVELSLMLMRTDPNGNLQWREDFGGPGYDTGRDVLALPRQGGYLACGASDSFDPDLSPYLIKVDVAGEEEWYETYDLESPAQANALVLDHMGNPVLAGWVQDEGLPKQVGDTDAFLLKDPFDESDAWLALYGGEDNEFFAGLRMAPDQGFICGGGSEVDFIFSESDVYLVKTDENGEVDD